MSMDEDERPKLRIAVITAIPTPYRDPFWNVLAASDDIALEIIYCAHQKDDRPWKVTWEQAYTAHYPKCINLAARFGAAASLYWNPEIKKIIREGRFDGIIVGGYNHLTMLWVIWYARRKGIPYFLASESYLQQKRAQRKHLIKSWLVRNIVSNARGCLPTGRLASEYLIHYGAKEENLCLVPNIPDVERFYEQAERLVPDRNALRRDRELTRITIIFVGRFIGMKGGHLLIEAFAPLAKELDADLVMLGDGPKRTEWETLTRKLGLEDRVRFAGFQSPEKLPEWFAAGDLMCLPSTNETWSVVVLEALSSGVPVVITDRVGCYPNAITDPLVGEVTKAGDVESLRAGLKAQLAKGLSRKRMFEVWAETRGGFRYEQVAERLAEALRRWCR